MRRSIRSLVPLVAVAVSMWAMIGFAEIQQVSPDTHTVEQTRAAFSMAGYQVDQAHTWDWTSPSVSSFQVQDTARDRVLMVLVYPSMTAANAARTEAQTREQALNGGSPVNGDSGPHLVIGYGPSTWFDNVALVETTGTHLQQLYQMQIERDNGLSADPNVVQDRGEPTAVVDADFQQALQSSVVNL